MGRVPPGLDSCRALLVYDGPARQLVTNLKYRNDRRVVSWLVEAMATLLEPSPTAVVTWVPTTPERRRRRGFDQAGLLARGLARRWDVPCLDLLVRDPGPPQTGRSLSERQSGIAVRLKPDRPRRQARQAGLPGVSGRQVVLVDDVVTTGATLRDAATVLRRGGASSVVGVALARTPRSH
jgi:competence protein ComFC